MSCLDLAMLLTMRLSKSHLVPKISTNADFFLAQKWLIIFDNAENPNQLQNYWPGGGNGSIIVTTRHKNIFFDMTQAEIQIDPFSEEEGAKCLLSLLTEEHDVPLDRTAALQLSQQLGGLPLGISQLAAFTRTRQLTLETCAKLYGQRKRRMHTDANARYSEYKQDLTTVWAMQFYTLNEYPDSRALLGVLTFLSPDSVQECLFNIPWEFEDPQIPGNILFCKDEMEYVDSIFYQSCLPADYVQKASSCRVAIPVSSSETPQICELLWF